MYTNEKHALILLSLLKENNIKKVIVSPGSTNIPITVAVQKDDYFEVYSSVDERSAAYMAIGLSQVSGEPVVISCTGATASRNYMSGLTEAFYRKLPIISITSFNGNENIGHLVAQNLDRRIMPNDTVKINVQIPYIHDPNSEWECNTLINKALIECRKDGGGPVNINIPSLYSEIFSVKELPKSRVISYANYANIGEYEIHAKKIGFFIGSHKEFSDEEVIQIDQFCEKYNAVVFCDHTSGYYGKYKILGSLVCSNFGPTDSNWNQYIPDIVFHLGEVSGDYSGHRVLKEAKKVWRISEDGKVRDLSRKLDLIYHGNISSFLSNVNIIFEDSTPSFFRKWKIIDQNLRFKFNKLNLPFSNIWIASQLHNKLPYNSVINFAILNSLRSWNFFNLDASIRSYSNVGGFGIDGCMSSAIGGALAKRDKLHFLVIGDLSFFYDINSLANRHLPSNFRILLINNGGGIEFKNYSHMASEIRIDSNELIAAGGHFNSNMYGTSSISRPNERRHNSLAKAWCEKLNFNYYSASNKEDFIKISDCFFRESQSNPIIIEAFTNDWEESLALKVSSNFDKTNTDKLIQEFKNVLPKNYKTYIKKILGKND